jgi:hypothetical protein
MVASPQNESFSGKYHFCFTMHLPTWEEGEIILRFFAHL